MPLSVSSTRRTPGSFWDAMRERLKEFALSLHQWDLTDVTPVPLPEARVQAVNTEA
jgi:hypothetical protein